MTPVYSDKRRILTHVASAARFDHSKGVMNNLTYGGLLVAAYAEDADEGIEYAKRVLSECGEPCCKALLSMVREMEVNS